MKARNSFIRKISALLICLSILLSTIPAGLSIVMAEEDSDLSSGPAVETPVVTATPEATATPVVNEEAEEKQDTTKGNTITKIAFDNKMSFPKDTWTQKEDKERNKIYYVRSKNVTAIFTIATENFDAGKVEYTINGETVSFTYTYSENDGKYIITPTYAFEKDGEYKLRLKYGDEAVKEYTIVIDTAAPAIDVEHIPTGEKTFNDQANNTKYYNNTVRLRVKVTEAHFSLDNFKVEIKATDFNGNKISGLEYDENELVKTYIDEAKDQNNWFYLIDANGNKVKDINADGVDPSVRYIDFVLSYKFAANYDITFKCTENFVNSDRDLVKFAQTVHKERIVIDREAPVVEAIVYSDAIKSYVDNKNNKTEFYNKDQFLTATLKAKDAVPAITFVVTIDEGKQVKKTFSVDQKGQIIGDTPAPDYIENIVASTESGYTVIKFDIKKEFKGRISYYATDPFYKSLTVSDTTVKTVVDNIAPNIGVEYTPGKNVTEAFYNINGLRSEAVSSIEDATQVFYNGKVKAEIKITEEYFYEGKVQKINGEDVIVHNVGILLTKINNDGTKQYYEYLPKVGENFAARMFAETIDGVNVERVAIDKWTLARIDGNAVNSYAIQYEDDADYILTIKCADFANNSAEHNSKPVTIDTTAPEVKAEVVVKNAETGLYEVVNPLNVDKTGREYFKNAKLRLTVKEHNFSIDKIVANIVDVDSKLSEDQINAIVEQVRTKTWYRVDGESDTYYVFIDLKVEANYTANFEVYDLANKNDEDTTENYAKTEVRQITVDKTAPIDVNVTYSDPIGTVWDKIINNLSYGFYNDSTKCEVTIEATDATAGIEYFDVVLKNVKTSATDVETKKFTLNADGSLRAGELGKITVKSVNKSIVADGEKITITLNVPAQFRGAFDVTAYDKATNKTRYTDEKVAIVDTVAPNIDVKYDKVEKDTIRTYYKNNAIVTKFSEADQVFYNGAAQATITVTDANFFEGVKTENGEILHNIGIFVTKTDAEGKVTIDEYVPTGAELKNSEATKVEFDWKTKNDVHTMVIPYDADADYVLTIDYTDFSENDAVIGSDDKDDATKTYTSKPVTVDTTPAIVKMEFNPAVQTVEEHRYYNEAKKPVTTITVTEHNFYAKYVDIDVTAINKLGDVVIADFKAFAKEDGNWKHDGNVHTLEVPYTVDGTYDIKVSEVKDLAMNVSADKPTDTFTYDTTMPSDVKVTYSDPIGTVWDKIIDSLSYGFYNDETKCDVTIEATDVTAGIEYFGVKLNNVKDSATNTGSELEFELNADGTVRKGKLGEITVISVSETITGKIVIKLNVPAQFRGAFEVTAYDKSTNNASYSDEKVAIIDTVAPNINVEYSAVNKDTTASYYIVNGISAENVNSFKDATNLFYNGAAQATITVTDTNFFEGAKTENGEILHNIGIFVTKTDAEGNVTTDEYVPTGAELKNSEATKIEFNWKTENDVHTMVIPYDADADYVLTVEYTDFSENDAVIGSDDKDDVTETYTSKPVTVDTKAPEVEVTYDYVQEDIKNDIDGRKYFDKNQSMTIAITEHNFFVEGADIQILAKNSAGGNANGYNYEEDPAYVVEFIEQALKTGNWYQKSENRNSQGVNNIYYIDINFNVDANYTFDIDYADLATNASADYVEDKFTVDKVMPECVSVEYSQNVFQEVLQAITFGYYKAPVTVTITATDATSGVFEFTYGYRNADGVSSVNAELLEQIIAEAEVTFSEERQTATTTFSVPKEALTDRTQFNGHIEFLAKDRSGNTSEQYVDNDDRIIVDDIAPTIQVTYNTPAATRNGIHYYTKAANNGAEITGTIVINEANFDWEDVVVTLTKDGSDSNYSRSVTWTDNNVDSHTGRFSVKGDGDYVVKVAYTDKSGNIMETYTSPKMIIDTATPEVTITKLEPGSHNNDETIGFVLTIVDRNIPLKGEKYEDNIKVTFTGAANQGDKGYVYKAPEVQLGTPDVSTDGRITTYTYTIDNLPNDDAFYNLNCQVKDFATNEMNEISWGAVDAQGNKLTTDNVTFSVNRNGSVFWIETKLNGEEADLNGKYINGEVTLILHELNVDKVGEGNDKTALTINDGSKTTTVALNDSTVKKNVIVPEGQGGWYETIYTLDNSYFDHDGVYSINLISYDEAGNSNVNTKSEAGVISYTVDRTKPVIVSNVKTKDIINATEHIVVIKITETNLDENITLEFYDNRGNKVDVEYENLGYNEFSFKVGQVFNHTIKVVAKDYAGNVSDVYQVEEFTVSTSIFVRFYANTTLFWSVVGGAVLLSVGVIAFIILKNKKKED